MTPQRDAIHVPTITLKAHDNLNPAEPVGVNGDKTAPGALGIVDPFNGKVERGNICTVWLNPQQTTKVTHLWSHPLIDGKEHPSNAGYTPPQQTIVAELDPVSTYPDRDWTEYVAELALKLEVSEDTLIGAADYCRRNVTEVGGYQPAWNEQADVDWEEFWHRYNTKFNTNVHFGDPFCC